jgi:dihydroflavonol-4-reductase
MKAFVTGGTGFIGRRVIAKLLERGWQVNALVRSRQAAEELRAAGVKPVWGDITARASLADGMRYCDVVFHMAAWYELGGRDWRKAEEINVEGTRNVLEVAWEMGVPRIIYTSSVAVYGDTQGFRPEEGDTPQSPRLLTEYDRTKYLAHYQVALPLIQKGAPVIIVMPGVVYGPGDASLNGQMMRAYYQGLFSVLPGADTTLTYAHVDDIAEGHLLAAEKGRVGESYHLTGDEMALKEAVQMWARASGHAAPRLYLPGRWLQPLAPLMGAINSLVPLPSYLSQDAVAVLGATYIASSDKARRELGWQTRPLEQGLQETFDWIAASTPPLRLLPQRLLPQSVEKRQAAALALGLGAGVMLAWLLWKRGRRS